VFTLPFDRIEITTKLKPEEVRARLSGSVYPRHWLLPLFGFGGGGFSGRVGADRFTIVRKISYQNSYLPIVFGKVRADGHGSSIAIMFVAPLCVIVLGTVLTSVLLLANNHQWDAAELFALLGALVHLACWVAYGDEQTKAEAYLRELLDK
jgi:hypothetical protein